MYKRASGSLVVFWISEDTAAYFNPEVSKNKDMNLNYEEVSIFIGSE